MPEKKRLQKFPIFSGLLHAAGAPPCALLSIARTPLAPVPTAADTRHGSASARSGREPQVVGAIQDVARGARGAESFRPPVDDGAVRRMRRIANALAKRRKLTRRTNREFLRRVRSPAVRDANAKLKVDVHLIEEYGRATIGLEYGT